MKAALKYWRAWREFATLPATSKRIVIYSESGQDWHHFKPVIDSLCDDFNESLVYLTSDPDDPGLSAGRAQVTAFCVGSGLIRTMCFQWLEAGVMLMTMVDFNKLQLKRSVNPVTYAFMFHSLISTHMADHADSYDYYDAVLCAGPLRICSRIAVRRRRSIVARIFMCCLRQAGASKPFSMSAE
jgi:YidC/Oxa1 family membrane protein insertase